MVCLWLIVVLFGLSFVWFSLSWALSWCLYICLMCCVWLFAGVFFVCASVSGLGD